MDIGTPIGFRGTASHPMEFVDLYREGIEDAVYAEEIGFDHVYCPEHHFVDWVMSPLTLLAAVASRTSRIRLSPYVMLPGLYHPLRLAEEAVMVDLISNGRLDLGIGPHHAPYECERFGIPPNETFNRTYETLSIMEKCWTGEPFSYKSQHFEFNEVRMIQTPVQKPGPPIWVAAHGPQSCARAARRGYYYASGLSGSQKMYEEAWVKAGRDRKDLKMSTEPISIHIALSHEKAWDEAEEGLLHHLSFYRSRGGDAGTDASGRSMPTLPPVGQLRNVQRVGFQGIPALIGTVDEVYKLMEPYKNSGITEFCLRFGVPGLSQAARRLSMHLFATELLPEVKKW